MKIILFSFLLSQLMSYIQIMTVLYAHSKCEAINTVCKGPIYLCQSFNILESINSWDTHFVFLSFFLSVSTVTFLNYSVSSTDVNHKGSLWQEFSKPKENLSSSVQK